MLILCLLCIVAGVGVLKIAICWSIIDDIVVFIEDGMFDSLMNGRDGIVVGTVGCTVVYTCGWMDVCTIGRTVLCT